MPKRCTQECVRFCPMVKTGHKAIEVLNKAIVHENICVGCGICVKKCPFSAISIVALPTQLKGKEVHRYGKNGFVLYNLPVPRKDCIVGILGPNGTGKTTAVKILSGQIYPNLGKDECKVEDIFERFSGTELLNYFKMLYDRKIKPSIKPQYIEAIPKAYSGFTVKELIFKVKEREISDEVIKKLELDDIYHKKVEELSGGELQRLAVAASLIRLHLIWTCTSE